MVINFTFFLTAVVLLSGIIYGVDVIWFARQRAKKTVVGNEPKMPKVIEYARAFFPVLLLVLIIRSFALQIMRVPTGSLEPTVLPGDFILVNMFDYGLRLPVINKKIVALHEPKRGDLVVFHSPVNPSIDLVKRVVGLPGDRVSYIDKVIYINEKIAPQTFLMDAMDVDDRNQPWQVQQYQEDLHSVHHAIYRNAAVAADNFYDVVVPANSYFMMGDNRDDSNDSRFWGVVPEKNIVGKAFRVIFSWDKFNKKLRWHRFWNSL